MPEWPADAAGGMKISVVIPTYNAAKTLNATLRSANTGLPGAEIIVSDGGSTDSTAEIASAAGVRFVRGAKGRGVQMNAGAFLAKGDIFVFLHADTVLPAGALECVEKAFDRRAAKIAKFQLAFDHKHWVLRAYAAMTIFDCLLTSFGDQCIVISKDFFEALGGFPDWPLFEDVRIFQKAREKTRVHVFREKVVTSAEKFLKNGIFRQQWKNLALIISYKTGADPETLYQKYYR